MRCSHVLPAIFANISATWPLPLCLSSAPPPLLTLTPPSTPPTHLNTPPQHPTPPHSPHLLLDDFKLSIVRRTSLEFVVVAEFFLLWLLLVIVVVVVVVVVDVLVCRGGGRSDAVVRSVFNADGGSYYCFSKPTKKLEFAVVLEFCCCCCCGCCW